MDEQAISIEAIQYLSKKEWEKRYPNGSGGYRVEGAIGRITGKKKGTLRIGEEIQDYYPLPKGYLKYKIKAYLEIEKDTYLAVLVRRTWEWIVIALLTMSIVAIIFYYKNNVPNIDPGSEKYTPNIEISELMDPDKIIIPGYGDVKMIANTDMVYLALWNPDQNPCYFKYTIVLEENREVIYESKLVPPGEAVTTVKLNRVIPQGITKAVMQIETYKLDNYKEKMNGGEVNIQLIGIENDTF